MSPLHGESRGFESCPAHGRRIMSTKTKKTEVKKKIARPKKMKVTRIETSYHENFFMPKAMKKYPVDTTFVCIICNKKAKASFQNAYINGWPRCHGEAMTIGESTADIGGIMSATNPSAFRKTVKQKNADGTFAPSSKSREWNA